MDNSRSDFDSHNSFHAYAMKKISSNFIYLLLFASTITTGCSSANISIMKDIKIRGEKIIALDAEPAPWNGKIAETISKQGFKVITTGKLETRFVLQIGASAPTDVMHRCFAGGWNFDYYKLSNY